MLRAVTLDKGCISKPYLTRDYLLG